MEHKLPTLAELYKGDLALKKGQNDLNVLLNQAPPANWIHEHPFARGVRYIPIERIEYLLTRIFIKWRVEVKEIKILANSICCTVRLHYQNIENNEWSYQDGVGAAPLQTDKGAGAIDFNAIKSDAVMKAAPAAKTFAIKDAAEQIGKLFGKDLNRKDEIIYDSLIGAIPQEKPTSKSILFAHELIRTCTGDEDYRDLMEGKVNDPDLTVMELENIISELQMNQPKKY